LEGQEPVAQALEWLYEEQDSDAMEAAAQLLEEAEAMFPELVSARDRAVEALKKLLEQDPEKMME
jgi:hypothetical protein